MITQRHLRGVVFFILLAFFPGQLVFASTPDLAHWTTRNPLPQGGDLTGVCHGAGIYLVVGPRGLMLKSTDAAVWVPVSVGSEENLFDVVWNGSQFVAVGGNGENAAIYTSSDGATWTVRHTEIRGPVTKITWSGTQFVAVSYTGWIITSPDAITWTTVHSAGSWLTGVAAKGSAIVAVAYGNVLSSTTDGSSWTDQILPGDTSRSWVAAAVNASVFVVGSQSGEIFTSANGTNWTKRTSNTTTGLYDLIWNGSEFAGTEGGYTITSPDGVTWTEIQARPDGISMRLGYGNGKYFAVGYDGLIAVSTDLSSWSTRSYTVTSQNAGKVIYANHTFTATLGSSSLEKGNLLLSDDGVVWRLKKTSLAHDFNALLWTGAKYFGVGDQGWIVSATGLDAEWQAAVSGTTKSLRALAFNGTTYVAVGDEGVILFSNDGVAWSSQSLNPSIYLQDVIWSGSLFVAVGGGGKIFTSPDGETWTSRTSGTNYSLFSIVWSGSKFVALGVDSPNAVILTSSDGVAWTPQTEGSINTAGLYNAKRVIWGGGKFLIVGGMDTAGKNYSGVIYSSTDGIAWSQGLAGGVYTLSDAAWDGSNWIVVGQQGTILANTSAATVSPQITAHPESYTGNSFNHRFSVTAQGDDLHYQWFLDGEPVAGAVASWIDVSGPGRDYTVVVYNSAGISSSRFARLTAETPNPGRIINLSVRTKAGIGGNPLIVGFVVQGGGGKSILVRAGGPAISVAPFNVTGTMPDPTLELHDGPTVLANNDNWGDGGLQTTLAATFASVGAYSWLDTASKDAALTATVDGPRTVFVNRAASTAEGVVLVEAYDTESTVVPRMINVSARNYVGTGADVLIGGFVINGNVPKKILVRGVGPTLSQAPFNVPGVLSNPRLELNLNEGGVNRVVATNDDWGTEIGAAQAAVSAGAFALAEGAHDAALYTVLPPGVYTAVVSGVDNEVGEALVEIYEVP